MPVAVPELGSFDHVAETKEDLPWADLVTIDLSLFSTPEGKQQLAKELISALREKGFFYVKNFNISQEKVNRQFAIGKKFYELPLEEKMKYVPDLANGGFTGYIPAGHRVIDEKSGLRDRVEMYNVPKFNGDFPREHPEVLHPHLAEMEEFARALHSEVLNPLFVLLAIALELPEDTITNMHKYEDKSEDHTKYIKYGKYTPDEIAQLTHWLHGHTDLGSITLLFRQPVAALQIQDPLNGKYRWVKPQDGTLTINAGDSLNFLTGGYVRSTIHRVTVPPKDQQHVDRLGVLYFSRMTNSLPLHTLSASPVLQRAGYTQNDFERTGNPVPTMEEWTFAKQRWQRRILDKVDEDARAVILPGFEEKIHEENGLPVGKEAVAAN